MLVPFFPTRHWLTSMILTSCYLNYEKHTAHWMLLLTGFIVPRYSQAIENVWNTCLDYTNAW